MMRGDSTIPRLWLRRLFHRSRRFVASSRSRSSCGQKGISPSCSLRSRGPSRSRSATARSSSTSTGPRGTTSPSRRCTATTRPASILLGQVRTWDEWAPLLAAGVRAARRVRRARGCLRLGCEARRSQLRARLDAGARRERLASRGRALPADAPLGRPPARHPLRRRAGERPQADRRGARRARRARGARSARGAVRAGGQSRLRGTASRSSACSACRRG